MDIFLVVVAFVFLGGGIVGAIIPVVPGPALGFAGFLIMQLSGRADFSAASLWLWAIACIAISVMDFILPSIFTSKFGGSRAAGWGSILGLLAGIFFFPPFGIIIGPFAGALIVELIQSNADWNKSLKAALGAFLAFIVGTGAKLVVGILMLIAAIMVLL